MKILLIDNYDSFTYNLAQYLLILGVELHVAYNDQITIAEIGKLQPDAMVISPGPGTPSQAGATLTIIQRLTSRRLPILGICLGHQALAEALGGKIIHSHQVMHGKASQIQHDSSHLFKNCPNPLTVGRYHSSIIDSDTLPDSFSVTAWTNDQEIMAIQHNHWPLFGVQFHPESVLSDHGLTILHNFLTVIPSIQAY